MKVAFLSGGPWTCPPLYVTFRLSQISHSADVKYIAEDLFSCMARAYTNPSQRIQNTAYTYPPCSPIMGFFISGSLTEVEEESI